MRRKLQLLRFFVGPYPGYVVGLLLTSVGFLVLEAVTMAVVYPMMTVIIAGAPREGNRLTAWFQPLLVAIEPKRQGVALLSMFAVAYILLSVFGYLRSVLSDVFSRVVTRDFQSRVFEKYVHSDYHYLQAQQQGTILFRTLTAPAYMTVMFGSLPKFLVALLQMAVVGAVLLLINVRITLAMIGLGLVFYAGVKAISQRVMYRVSQRMQSSHERLTVLANEAITGIKEIKIRAAEDRWVAPFRDTARRLSEMYIWTDIVRALPAAALQVGFMALLLTVVLGDVDESASHLGETLPLAGVYAFAFLRVAPSLTDLASQRMMIAERLPYAEAVYQELTQPSQQVADGSTPASRLARGIRLEHLSFTHPGRERTLENIDLTFDKGRTTAVVGASGSGKTTIADLIVCLFHVTSGRILVDDRDVRELKRASWLEHVGYVNQDPFLFNGTVRDNIAFGVDSITDAEVEKAARAADAHDFVIELPRGYETNLGDRGVKLSGGQRQRIAIARALARKPEILIFDEATSALDSVSEREVQRAINKAAENHTVIVIAHRLSTVRDASKIVVLDRGTVVEQGTHDSLLLAGGTYSRLYKAQEETPVSDHS
jgi:ABC-type multidrug transport system fused ATPase/permease subunit